MISRSIFFRTLAAASLACLTLVAQAAEPGVADRVIRTKAAGIDILVYPMDVKNVVSLFGNMPLGDAVVAARKTNPAVPELTTAMLKKGTVRQDKFQIADALARKGAALSLDSDTSQVIISGRSLRSDLGLVIQVMADQLRRPKFSPEELAKTKLEAQAGLQAQLDDGGSLATEAMALALYPASNPNGTVSNAEMVKAVNKVTVADLQAFHKRNFGPAHMTLVFAGDVDVKEVERLVGAAFSGWTGGQPLKRWGAGEYRAPALLAKDIPMADKASVTVLWTKPTGLLSTDDEALPMDLAASVLGSGFTSRLLSTVRDQEGLTYGIGAASRDGDLSGGDLLIQTSFAPDLMERGIASTKRELEKWYRDGISAEELAQRKSAAIGRQRLALGTTGGMAYSLLQTVIRGQPVSAIDTYPQRINAVTVEQANAAIRKYGDPSKFMMVRAGTFPKK